MDKIRAMRKDNMLIFNHVAVRKDSETFYGVYKYYMYGGISNLITSGRTFKEAAKKAKYIEIGYRMCREHMPDYW